MKIEKSILALIAFVAVFMAVLTEARLGRGRGEMFALEDETMFDGRERYIKRVPRGKDNPAGFIVRSTPGEGGGWIKQVSNSENRNGMHYFSSVKDEDETMFDGRDDKR